MDGIASNDVIKRRLPPWMLGVAPVDKGRVGDPTNDNDNRHIDDGGGSRDDEKRVKKRGGRRPKLKVAAQEKKDDFSNGLGLKEEKEESSALLVKCENRKRTKRKLHLDVEDAPKRKKQKGMAKRNTQISEDDITGGCLENGEDEDLTVEDLMIFAKECLQGDIGAKEVESLKEDQFRDTVQAVDVQEIKRLSEGHEISSSSGVTMGNVDVNVTSEASGCKPSMSGDPTQDMLDLLLGPLLKKTQDKEKKKVDLTTEDMDFNFDVRRQGRSAAHGEEQATVRKKKSSLRERVAMLLN